jgi:RNA polymerase sigma-70 factor (ECF subfamily)
VWKDSHPDEDRKLVGLCREGDPLAFETLVRKHQQTVLNLAYHYIGRRNDIEDVAQKVFTKVYFSLDKYDTSRPFLPWLIRITINQCYDELRKIRRQKLHLFSEMSFEENQSLENLIHRNALSQADDKVREDMHALLYSHLDRLRDPQRTAIVLRDLEAVPYEDIARIFKCSEQAARLKVFRARARLKKLIQETLDRKGK